MSEESQPQSGQNRFRELKFYKPRQNGQGAASTWSFSAEKQAVFLEMANQMPSDSEHARFDWDNRLALKLGLPDLGELLAVLDGRKPAAGPKRDDGKFSGLFHRSTRGDAALAFARSTADDGFHMKIGVRKDGGEPRTTAHSLTEGEGCVLRVALETAVARIGGWA